MWKRNFTVSSAAEYNAVKLAPKFVKCMVIRCVSTSVYDLQDMNRHPLNAWHVQDIKLHDYCLTLNHDAYLILVRFTENAT